MRKVAFITGASRGIGAQTALAFARAGYDVAITARTLAEGESHTYGAVNEALPGSLNTTADKVRAIGQEALCLQSDILKPDSVLSAIEKTIVHYGQIDVLFNNACYQGPGNLQRLLDVTPDQIQAVFQGNVITPTLAVQATLAHMIARGSGTIINMVSGSAINNPPAPADKGGWGFVYPASKAALIRMVPSLRVEHPQDGFRFFNVEPGFVYTEAMKANNFGEEAAKKYGPTDPEDIAKVVVWLTTSQTAMEYYDQTLIHAPQLINKMTGI